VDHLRRAAGAPRQVGEQQVAGRGADAEAIDARAGGAAGDALHDLGLVADLSIGEQHDHPVALRVVEAGQRRL